MSGTSFLVSANSIVIRRAELPVVTADASNVWAGTGHLIEARLRGCNVANLRTRALNLLAIAEYLDAHPPIDEAQVEALAGLVERAAFADGVPADEVYPTALARNLWLAGVRPPRVTR